MKHLLLCLTLCTFVFVTIADDALFSVGGDSFAISSAPGQTVKVSRPEEFPRQISPGQRIAIFLPEIEPENLLFFAGINEPVENDNSEEASALNIVFNKHPLFRAEIGEGKPIRVVIPYSYLEKGENSLEIVNLSLSPITFSRVKVEQFGKSAAMSGSPDSAQSKGKEFVGKISSTVGKFSALGGKFAKKLPAMIAELMVGFIQEEQCLFSFADLAREKSFFDPASGKPIPAYGVLRQISPFFEGSPELLPCNLIPFADDDILHFAKWMAVKNADGIYTILVSGSHENGKRVKIVIPLGKGNENFKFRYSVASEFSEPDKKAEWKDAETKNGVIECDFALSDCTVIRIVKEGTKEPENVKMPDTAKVGELFCKDVLKVTDKRPGADLIRTALRWSNGHIGVNGRQYSAKEADTTSGIVDGVENIVPWDKKSNIVEISFTGNEKDKSGGATLFFGDGPKKAEEFSFWVYPRAGKNIDKTTLQFILRSDGKPNYLAVNLVPEKWQRIVVPCEKIKPPYWGNLCVVGDPKLPEYANGGKVSFEFNGFCVTGDMHPEKGKSGLKTVRIVGSKDNVIFIIAGEPGKYFEYRHQFKEPMDLTRASELSGSKELKYVYIKEPQIFEISGIFPDIKKAEMEKNQTDVESVKPEKEPDFPISDEVRKILLPAEIKKAESGDTSVFAVKLDFKR